MDALSSYSLSRAVDRSLPLVCCTAFVVVVSWPAMSSLARAISEADELVYIETAGFARTARPGGSPAAHEIDLVALLAARMTAQATGEVRAAGTGDARRKRTSLSALDRVGHSYELRCFGLQCRAAILRAFGT